MGKAYIHVDSVCRRKNKNQKFFKESISKELYDVLRMFKRLNVLYKGGNQETGRMAVPFRILQELDAGNVKIREESKTRNSTF